MTTDDSLTLHPFDLFDLIIRETREFETREEKGRNAVVRKGDEKGAHGMDGGDSFLMSYNLRSN